MCAMTRPSKARKKNLNTRNLSVVLVDLKPTRVTPSSNAPAVTTQAQNTDLFQSREILQRFFTTAMHPSLRRRTRSGYQAFFRPDSFPLLRNERKHARTSTKFHRRGHEARRNARTPARHPEPTTFMRPISRCKRTISKRHITPKDPLMT